MKGSIETREYVVVKGAHIKLSREKCASGMVQRKNTNERMRTKLLKEGVCTVKEKST